MGSVEIKTNSNHLVGPLGPKIAKNIRMAKFHFDLVPIKVPRAGLEPARRQVSEGF